MKNNITLVGFMGAGKTTIGKLLSETLNFNFIDTDELIAQEAKMTITEIFETKGENYFRTLETNLLKKLALDKLTNTIISIGGGAFCKEENIAVLNALSLTVYLKVTYETLLKRFSQEEIAKRPLLKEFEKVQNLLLLRENFYQQANLVVNTDKISKDEIKEEIITFFKGDTNESN
jgi:shikimate kinase